MKPVKTNKTPKANEIFFNNMPLRAHIYIYIYIYIYIHGLGEAYY